MSSLTGYVGDYNYSRYTPLDNTGYLDFFKSGYKNIRFNIVPIQQIQLTSSDAANLPGLAFRLYGDTSLWRALMAYNGLSDPISDIVVGIVLSVPSKADIIAYLSRQTNNKQNSLTI
jgi:hypothetical protein